MTKYFRVKHYRHGNILSVKWDSKKKKYACSYEGRLLTHYKQNKVDELLEKKVWTVVPRERPVDLNIFDV